jgi:hypothetical protein
MSYSNFVKHFSEDNSDVLDFDHIEFCEDLLYEYEHVFSKLVMLRKILKNGPINNILKQNKKLERIHLMLQSNINNSLSEIKNFEKNLAVFKKEFGK